MANDNGTVCGGKGLGRSNPEGNLLAMLIQKLKQHFPARFPEWINAGILASWGAYIILHPEIFSQSATREVFAEMAEMVWIDYHPAAVWGLVAFSVGAVRGLALFINGAYSRTPLIRLVSSAVSAFVWAQVVIGLMGVSNTGIVVYSWLVVIDIASAYRAGVDVAIAEKHRSANRSGAGRVGSNGYNSGRSALT